MAVVVNGTRGCCGEYPASEPGARAELYAGRDQSIRGLYGLRGPRPGDSDYVDTAPTAPTVDEPVLTPESNAMKYVAFGALALAATGFYFYTR